LEDSLGMRPQKGGRPQQAAEKDTKGFLAWHNVPFRRVHSLEEIGEQCLQIEPGLRYAVDRVVPILALVLQPLSAHA
jgi:hypothetical protein